jgi:acyl-CoA reductase-like NAD-dependent aldehyde dehydrogenase
MTTALKTVTAMQKTISPVDGRVYLERPLATPEEVERALAKAQAAQAEWGRVPAAERAAICARAVDALASRTDELAEEISWQMGRPIRHAPREIEGFAQRTGYMIGIAPETLADIEIRQEPGLNLFMRREPLGVVLTLAAWNYPYLIPAGSTVPALLAGNAVVLKHSAQTPLCAERLAEAFTAGGLPEGVFQYIHTGHGSIEGAIKSAYVDFVAFTGSVEGGRAVHVAAGPRFIGSALELGGKDPAYVRHDADLEPTIESLVDGNGYNTGQSCCAIERIYVHADVYDRFVEGFTELTKRYRLGNPMDPETTLGPMVRTDAAEFVRKQVSDAVRAGARALIDPSLFPEAKEGTPYLEPQVLVDVDHSMDIMC